MYPLFDFSKEYLHIIPFKLANVKINGCGTARNSKNKYKRIKFLSMSFRKEIQIIFIP